MNLTLKDGRILALRAATNADRAAVIRHIYGVLAEYGLTGEPEGADHCLADLEGNYVRTGGLFELVEDSSGALVGCFGLRPEAAGVCELRKMYLSRSVRGQGLGRQLLAHALACAKAKGFRRVELTTAAPLKEAVALYQSFGFTPCMKADLPERCDRSLGLALV